ncbi:MAG: hypothetical protein OXC14_04510, partial [Rhodospirillaceae bacterium]|nr:hypothetical protein [Rhodospirillaceae bacterium]
KRSVGGQRDGLATHRYDVVETGIIVGPWWDAPPRNAAQFNAHYADIGIMVIAVQLCEKERRGWRLRGVYEQLSEGFAGRLEEITERLNMERVGKGLEFHDVRREAADWMRAHGGPLNGFAALTHRSHRGQLPDAEADGLSAFFADSLTAWVQGQDGGRVKARSDVRAFVDRATGYRGAGQGVRWNRETNGFEDVPWALGQITAEEPPPGAFRFEDDFRGRARLEKMKWVVQRGFEVKENYPAREAMLAGKWMCTLCGRKQVAPGSELSIRFWEHPDDEDGFLVEVAGGEESKEGRLTRDVMQLWSENTREKGARVVQLPEDEATE